MGKHLDAAKAYIGRDAAGMLAGGRYALVHTRSMEFDELRPYVPGDDVRDIDWKATARSGHPLVKQFVTEKHHKILVVADGGRNARAETPTGEPKWQLTAHVIGAIGLITLPRSDEIGLVTGDRRGCVDIRLRRGETHIERMLHRYHQHVGDQPEASDIVVQLQWVARHQRHPLLVIVVSDEPDISDRLRDTLRSLGARHDVLWAMVGDRPAVDPGDPGAGYDVADGRRVLGLDILGERVVRAYRRAEEQRRQDLSEFLTELRVPHARIASSAGIAPALVAMTGVYARAG
ncbi:DUF58 domain-containing protein [Mycolicibacterium neoaurum]|uniref:DUF58 domain-containing protein n=1 Tax=Mycolicibacterium neoaurum TaxID=1795 RepID=UPI00248D315D|nr:DUF58 domain-containing protein [Mycolicibacterium neoaurum]WBP94119.1 DUF58 domain-containing protein [Mycolicibacterium neoaurum]WBS07892.1 DUF58 domain-containing protein [Mycolicibacterium neoaurum]